MSFKHSPFTQPGSELRLVRLLHPDESSSDEGIALNVVHVLKDDHILYTAVSYRWVSYSYRIILSRCHGGHLRLFRQTLIVSPENPSSIFSNFHH